MTKELLISSSPHETKVAVLEDDQLVEVYFQRDVDSGMVGGIYKGKVNRVLPGMQSAFVDIGLDRDAFLYVSDFFEESEEYDRVFTDAENRAARASGALTIPGETPVPDPSRAETAPDTPVNPEPPAGAERLSTAKAEAPPEETAPVAAAELQGERTLEPPASSPPKEGAAEERKHDFHGRRNRRRGRGFRENRFGARREDSEKPREFHSEGASRPLEPLPGESLAKYGGSATETTHEGSIEVSESRGADDAVRPLAAATAEPGTVENREEFPGQPKSGEAYSTGSGAAEFAPELAEGPAKNLEPAQELGAEGDSFEDVFAAAGRVFDERVEASNEEDAEAFEEDEPLDEAAPDEAGGGSQRGSANSGELTGLTAENAEEAEPAAPGEETSSSAPGEVAADQPPSGQSYTLRDYPQRPRTAPRRGRKGGRPFRGHRGPKPESSGAERSRAGNHYPLPISELLKEGQEILVQIAKEPLGTKGARITSHIALPGRYLVYMPTITHIGVSRKIGSDEERLRLRNILLENRGSLTGGFIVRTAGAGRSEEELKADLAFLTNLWNDIRTRAERSKAPALLHRDLTLVERILRDLLSPDFKCVRVDNESEYEHVLDFVNRFQPALIGQVKLYSRDAPLFEEFGVQVEIDKALKPKVWLRSGGYIVINQTEALVAIDVNTGKYVGKTNRLEDTIVKTNIDAVMEIVRQIRLRDLGGIIVIDFIDMDEWRNRAKVVQALEDALRHDRAPTKILSFNEFGLVALTRKRAKQSLERTLCEPCPYCTGAGWVKSAATVTNEIVAEARKMALQIEGKVITLRVNPQVAAVLKSKAGAMISEIEAVARKEVVIKSDAAVQQERFEIF